MADLIAVHDPRGYPPKVTGKRLAPRLQSLDGKLVYLVDCLFDNSAAFMEQTAAMVRRRICPRSRRASSSRARAGSTTPTCARRSAPTAMPPFSVSGFEAPVARRSSG